LLLWFVREASWLQMLFHVGKPYLADIARNVRHVGFLSQSGALRSAIRGYNSARDIPIAKSQARTRLKVHRYQLAALLGGRIWKSVGSPPSLSAELPAGWPSSS